MQLVKHYQKLFPKAFFEGDFLIDNFPSGNFPKVRLGPLRRRRLQWGVERCGQDGLGGRAPRLEQAWGRKLRLGQTWEIAHLESCHLGKYPWEVSTREKSRGKVPNIILTPLIPFSGVYISLCIDEMLGADLSLVWSRVKTRNRYWFV